MEHTWRWFGPADPVTLPEIRQTGATGVVSALHEFPNGTVWPVEAILARKAEIEAAGLTWSVVESIPVHEDIKSGEPGAARRLDAWAQTVRNLGRCGIDTVCYNFMPVLDWTRTDLAYALPDGSWALRFDHVDLAVFDVHLLRRPGAEDDYAEADLRAAAARLAEMTDAGRARLIATVIAGLPGAEETYTVESLREDLRRYDGVGADELRGHLRTFLEAVVPAAEEAGVRLAIHPDDPPRPLLGLPRVVSTASDARWLLDAVDSPASGLTFCTGSYGVREDNDLVAMARELADRIFFVHLRSTVREADPRSFHEGVHIDGDVDMVGVIRELLLEEDRRAREGGPRLPMRPDHGHQILLDQDPSRRTNPGYTLLGRMKGLAELRGVELAVRSALTPVPA
ncbi:mannonate dehydratase [Demequina sp. SYSU T00039]|uniref:Mannonate dehydratase n=1 Tax=Demequina lignilytica TaxID=3051663 RepID=A0AAW7M0Z4_9MICO|nr:MULTISPECIES: mannonate dehydratase [unclassified Demequina]MDN4478569.1 mannonate dehydratase [Demequina sp. SYSU T00039-1]MDN4486924.1 mannonate dehydratase [Demequina sp. SYSU T00039]